MAAYRGADSFRAPTDQVYGPYASLHLSVFGESSGFDRLKYPSSSIIVG